MPLFALNNTHSLMPRQQQLGRGHAEAPPPPCTSVVAVVSLMIQCSTATAQQRKNECMRKQALMRLPPPKIAKNDVSIELSTEWKDWLRFGSERRALQCPNRWWTERVEIIAMSECILPVSQNKGRNLNIRMNRAVTPWRHTEL